MPLPRRDLEFDPMLLLAGRPQLPSTAMESFKATVQDPTLRPTQLLGMHAERERLAGNGWLKRLGEQTAKFHTGQPLDPEPTLSPKQKELLDPDRVKEDFGHLGLSYDRPTPRGVVEFDAKTKQAEMRRAEILENAPSGIIGSLARFGVGFAGSVADPINLASGVIPVFGGVRATAAARSALTTRFTQTMRPSLARAGARAVEGTAAGFVGSVAVEPAIYGLSRQLQLDYDMTDSLLNVTFGQKDGVVLR